MMVGVLNNKIFYMKEVPAKSRTSRWLHNGVNHFEVVGRTSPSRSQIRELAVSKVTIGQRYQFTLVVEQCIVEQVFTFQDIPS